ncbi:uncharacterized protein AB675_1493 [Cyphellophora attinorum]|uniref:F-box domain-containing protein n=1 Tax=Cyphellophora attinorum TaxID=1664694 RepID=A0A0N1H5V0_9EURO|nr:uncharacterized protein AB675_1493 [Phialophora attinorum]KPI37263.1 hypothetical protein AB675_1493 [Phialophora attinorum]
MARFVDLDDSDEGASVCDNSQAYLQRVVEAARLPSAVQQPSSLDKHADRSGTDHASSASFAAVLACFPVALSLAKHLDLNDLHSLSLTSRSIHRNLTQYSRHLKAQSLRCTFDDQPLLSDLRKSDSPSLNNHTRSPEFGIHSSNTANSPHPTRSAAVHETTSLPAENAAFSVRSARSASSSSRLDDEDEPSQPVPPADSSSTSSFTLPAFLRLSCACATRGAYLCAACGHNLRANDTTYRRVWTWRSRYSTHIGGGLGVGLGMGDQGQKCGRGSHCLDSSTNSVSWVEIDCSDGDGEALTAGSRVSTPVPHYQHRDTAGQAAPANSSSNKPGYHQQEIEGIGGVVKKKVRKRVKTGATVWEYDDERTSGQYLARETSGAERSWCGWCDRVCLGEGDDLASVLGPTL